MKILRAIPLLLVLLMVFSISRGQSQQTSPPAPGAAQAPAPPQMKERPLQNPAPPIAITANLVHLVATVTDSHHKLITDLDKNNFHVLENGEPQEIKFFGRETGLPLRIGLLLDTSNSIRPRLDFEKDAAMDFLTRIVHRDKDDQVFLMTFDNDPEVIQDYTTSLPLLVEAIRRQQAGGSTALNDAICLASQKLMKAPLPKGEDSTVRRVLVVISDGNDNLSDHTLNNAMEAAARAESSIYSISTNTQWLSVSTDTPKKYLMEGGDKILAQFADQSGGRVFFPYKVEDLAQSFLDIETELRSQYYIAYVPSNHQLDGRYRKVEVTTDHKGLTVRTRPGYFATPAPQQ